MTAIKIHPDDNVATLINDTEEKSEVIIISSEGETVQRVKALNSILLAHKLAIAKIEKDADIIKYGEVIGRATQSIGKGAHVHIHNVDSRRVR